jgi:hypothetical protein
MKRIFVFLLFFTAAQIVGQNDTLKLKNNELLVGEVKFFAEGILTIETSYSDEDFKIEFTFNYDNQPYVVDNDLDFIFISGFGWDFD